MTQLSLFDDSAELAPQAARLAPRLQALAQRGVFFGTSSWKYEGWLGSIYNPERYQVRGRFSRKKFEAESLAEYARVFPVVGGDFSFYQFPSPPYWQRLFGETPDTLGFVLKVPEDITVPRWPRHARYGKRAGLDNETFLSAPVFKSLFARRLDPYRPRVAALVFEFGTFARATFPTPSAFLDRLGPFLESLPEGFRYSIEIRNADYLGTAYFALLSSYNVAHVFNAWTRMPELPRQLDMPGVHTADFAVARALLPHGRSYEQAVQDLEPYKEIKEPSPPAREGLRSLAAAALTHRRPTFLLVNNRLEGNAPSTIEAVAEELES